MCFSWLRQVLISLGLAIGALAASPAPAQDAQNPRDWQQQQLQQLQRQLHLQAADDEERSEWLARQEWLKQWHPGPLSHQSPPGRLADKLPWLVKEPLFADYLELGRKNSTTADDRLLSLQKAAQLQQELVALDQPQVRKQNLRETAAKAEQLLDFLDQSVDRLPPELSPETLHWIRLHTLYRWGRALGYRELPDVLAKLPIDDPAAHDRQLRRVHQRLSELDHSTGAEFVLLDVRMKRRDGRWGEALMLLERFRWAIDSKWYLKKRRDILEQLGWEPAYRQAADAYAAYDQP